MVARTAISTRTGTCLPPIEINAASTITITTTPAAISHLRRLRLPQLAQHVDEQVVGLEAGAEKRVEFEIPDTSSNPEYVGKKAQFDVTIHEIKAKELPAVNDEFAAEMGFESVEQMRGDMRSRLDVQRLMAYNQAKEKAAREEIARRIEPLIREAGLWQDEFAGAQRAWLLRVIDLLKPRVKRLGDFIDGARPFLDDRLVRDPDAVRKHLGKAELKESFQSLRDALDRTHPFDPAELELTTRTVADTTGVKPAALIHATRVAVTGRAATPGLFEVLELLGRDRVIARMTDALSLFPH